MSDTMTTLILICGVIVGWSVPEILAAISGGRVRFSLLFNFGFAFVGYVVALYMVTQ